MVSPSSTPQPPLRVALLLYPGCMPAGLFAAADMARAANLRAHACVMDICWAGVDRLPVPTWQGPALAQALSLSPRSLARRVQAHTGLAAALWMRRIKLRPASEALCDTPLPLNRIAENLGFASEAGLHRAFRQATGQTPLAYRMAHGAR